MFRRTPTTGALQTSAGGCSLRGVSALVPQVDAAVALTYYLPVPTSRAVFDPLALARQRQGKNTRLSGRSGSWSAGRWAAAVGAGVSRRQSRRLLAGPSATGSGAAERPAKVAQAPAVWNTTGWSSCVVHQKHAVAQSRQDRFQLRLNRAPAATPSSSRTRSLSCSVCSRPMSQVPAFDRPL